MVKEVNSKPQSLKSKTLYKIELITLKFIPFIIALICFLNTILSYFGVDLEILSYIGGVSFFTLFFLYVSSYTFKFCLYHRLPLHYILINNVLNIIDAYIGIPLDDRNLLILYLVIAFIFFTLTIANYVETNKRDIELDN